MKYLFIFFSFFFLITTPLFSQLYTDLTPLQCDSLIQANEDNPSFVILDVRRPDEYIPEHLEAAINRDYYGDYFEEQIDSLDRNKKYLIHCKSGSRSNNTLNLMKLLEFQEVHNMIGGIKAWKNDSLAVTDQFSPLLMSISDTIYPMKKLAIGDIDTIALAITNRANAVLIFESICSVDGTEFFTDFDPLAELPGGGDYFFNIYYSPQDELADTLSFCLESNGGNIIIEIHRNGIDESSSNDMTGMDNDIYLYPNPASHQIYINGIGSDSGHFRLLDQMGRQVLWKELKEMQSGLHLSHFSAGIYTWQILVDNKSIQTGKLLINK